MKLTCRALTQTLVNLAIRPLNYIRSLGHRGKRSMCSVWLSIFAPLKHSQENISVLRKCQDAFYVFYGIGTPRIGIPGRIFNKQSFIWSIFVCIVVLPSFVEAGMFGGMEAIPKLSNSQEMFVEGIVKLDVPLRPDWYCGVFEDGKFVSKGKLEFSSSSIKGVHLNETDRKDIGNIETYKSAEQGEKNAIHWLGRFMIGVSQALLGSMIGIVLIVFVLEPFIMFCLHYRFYR